MTKRLQPIWFRLPKRFYARLEFLAQSLKLPPEEALEMAFDLSVQVEVTAHQNDTETKQLLARTSTLVRRAQKAADVH